MNSLEMTNQVQMFCGVRGYLDDNNMAWLNAEDVARGFGFVQIAKSGNEVVRWERVNKYLKEFGFIPTCGDGVSKDDFLPENMVYRLGFKANNETAQKFQALLADEILPTIRKTGSYTINKPKNKMQIMADELEATLNMSEMMQKFFKMDESTAKIFALRTGLNGSYKVIDSKTVDSFIKKLPASESNTVALLTATDLANELSSKLNKKISNKTVNQVLSDLGYQTKINKKWTLTDKANNFANQIPFQNDNGHLGFQIKWKNTILDVLLDYFKN